MQSHGTDYREANRRARRIEGLLTQEESTGHYWSKPHGSPLAIGERIIRKF